MTRVVEGIPTKAGADPMPLVPTSVRYWCHDCPDPHDWSVVGLLDTGCDPAVIMPAELLPEHVSWAGLTRTTMTYNGITGLEIRLWRADVSVDGVTVATDVHVKAPGAADMEGLRPVLDYIVHGRRGLFRHFLVGFAWANVPPIWTLTPTGQITPTEAVYTAVRVLEDRRLAFHSTPVADAGRMVASLPALPAPRPNRRQRRAAARVSANGRSSG